MTDNVSLYIDQLQRGVISTFDVAKLLEKGEISKTERRKITKLAKKKLSTETKELSERQKLR